MNPTLDQMTGPQQIDYVLERVMNFIQTANPKPTLDDYEIGFAPSVATQWKVHGTLTDKQVNFLKTVWYKITKEIINLKLNDEKPGNGNGKQTSTQQQFNYRPSQQQYAQAPGPPKPPPVTAQDFAKPKSAFSHLQDAYSLAKSLSLKLDELIHDRTTKPIDVKNYVHLTQILNQTFHFHD